MHSALTHLIEADAAERALNFDRYGPTDPETKAHAAAQWQQAKGDAPKVTCGCGLRAPMRFLFRCLYCGCWFCEACAEAHFGKTRAQYRAEQSASSTLVDGVSGPGHQPNPPSHADGQK